MRAELTIKNKKRKQSNKNNTTLFVSLTNFFYLTFSTIISTCQQINWKRLFFAWLFFSGPAINSMARAQEEVFVCDLMKSTITNGKKKYISECVNFFPVETCHKQWEKFNSINIECDIAEWVLQHETDPAYIDAMDKINAIIEKHKISSCKEKVGEYKICEDIITLMQTEIESTQDAATRMVTIALYCLYYEIFSDQDIDKIKILDHERFDREISSIIKSTKSKLSVQSKSLLSERLVVLAKKITKECNNDNKNEDCEDYHSYAWVVEHENDPIFKKMMIMTTKMAKALFNEQCDWTHEKNRCETRESFYKSNEKGLRDDWEGLIATIVMKRFYAKYVSNPDSNAYCDEGDRICELVNSLFK